MSVWGAANSGFRAPTLTELYRQFSVGAVTTRPNDQLAPERLVGGEAGINVAPARNVSVRLTWFDNRITNPVLNVTLSATLAQKQNVPETRVRGVQTDVDYRVGTSWRFSGGYIYDDATVTDGGAANAALVGKALQQVPKHRGTLQAAYSNAKYATVALGVQFVGLQYNDDLNVNFIPVATLADAGYDAAYPAGLPGLHGRRSERVAELRPQHPGVFRRAEPVRQGVFRTDQPVDDRHAAPRQRRAPRPLGWPLRATRLALDEFRQPSWPANCCSQIGYV